VGVDIVKNKCRHGSKENRFWEEVGQEWATTPNIEEALRIVNSKAVPDNIHRAELNYVSRDDMLSGFFTGIIKILQNRVTRGKILFVCHAEITRSKMMAEIWCSLYPDQTRFVGITADQDMFENQIKWAEVIICMEEEQAAWIKNLYPTIWLQKQISVLGIEDIYDYDDQRLIRILKDKFEKDLFSILKQDNGGEGHEKKKI
jgi:predicted protein tyrosine phosphatase